MLFKSTIISAFALCMASHALGAAIDSAPVQAIQARDAMIATDPYFACNCPSNCLHKTGSSCKYYSSPSDRSTVIKGKCTKRDGGLTCVA